MGKASVKSEPAEPVKQMYESSPSLLVLLIYGFAFFTLLGDGVVPPGFLREFVGLEGSIRRSSERSISLAAATSDAEAERLLAIEKKKALYHSIGSSSIVDQLVVAAEPSGKNLATRVRLRGRVQNQPNEVDGSICCQTH